MIQITDKHYCCGCSACASICPKHCITMQADSEGFLYPEVNEADCIDCGLCEKVCHELHPYEDRHPQKVYAALNKNEEVRMKSSSGGIFYLLAEKTIAEGGVVFGARFDEQWQVVIDYAETMEGIKAFMGSKYVQARMDTAYADAKRFLKEGRKVLFSGTPCQIAGLHHFLRKSYDNLLTVDVICHGTPSPLVWRKYLDELTKNVQRIKGVEHRNKKLGWKNFSVNIQYDAEEKIYHMSTPFQRDLYMNVFLKNIILRPSCYKCLARSGRSKSDITLADFWGIASIIPQMDDDKGTSLVFVNTDAGMQEFPFHCVYYKETYYETIKHLNPACYRSPLVHVKRDYFFKNFQSSGLFPLMKKCSKPTKRERLRILKVKTKLLLKKLLRIKCTGGVIH